MTTATQTNFESTIRLLKAAECSSASGKSTLTYHLGCTPESDFCIRMFANSRAGFFSKEWVMFTAIQQALAKKGNEEHFTSYVLSPLFRGKSVNTPAFLFAALRNEGLIQPSTKMRRAFERSDPSKFVAEMNGLIKLPVGTKVKVTPMKHTAKSKAAAPAKKTADGVAKKMAKKQ